MGWTLNILYLGFLAHKVFSFPLNEAQAILQHPPNYAVSTLPVPNATRSFWIDTPGANPLAKVGSEGELTNDADVCIIGSGITGVSAAYHLASAKERQLKVVILDARDFCQPMLSFRVIR